MNDFNFDNFNSNPNNDNNYSERDRLEIDSDGKKRGKQLEDKRKEQYDKYQNGNKRGMFNRGRGNFNGGSGSWWKILLTLAVVGGLIYIPIAYKNGTLPQPLRSLVGGDAQSNANTFLNDVQIFKNDSDKMYKNKWSDNYDEATETDFYDTNPLYSADYIGTQIDKEYMIFVYTGNDELDAPFKEWIENYEKEGTYKIYRIKMDIAIDNYYVEEAVTDDNYNITEEPLLMIFYSPEKQKTVLDSIVKDSTQLDKIPDYLKGLVDKGNANS